MKKIFRDRGGVVTDQDREELKLELGDVLRYLSELATQQDLGLDEIAAANIDKLQGRIERGGDRSLGPSIRASESKSSD